MAAVTLQTEGEKLGRSRLEAMTGEGPGRWSKEGPHLDERRLLEARGLPLLGRASSRAVLALGEHMVQRLQQARPATTRS